MSRIDFVKLRKRAKMSQRELADRLQIQPSFLSAIENGRSRMPDDKIARILEIFEIDDLHDYMIDDSVETAVPPHTHTDDQTDTLAQLLNHFHELAHQRSHNGPDPETEERIEYLTRRNDRLSDRMDTLREEVDALRSENLRLKELLIKAGFSY